MKERALMDAEKEKEKLLKEAVELGKRLEEEAILRSKESIARMATLAAEKILREKH